MTGSSRTTDARPSGRREQPLDLIVIGGGINGAGIARDAALRGLHVTLCEMRDLATGATWASSGMIHGGLRYLTSDPSVTRLSCLDSGFIQQIAPHLIFRIPFLLPWQEGARWFWDTLLDADLANNSLGWQWAAGCGADAAPYFRIFNPSSQAEKFDADAAYIKRWVPELSGLPADFAREPWKAPPLLLAGSGVVLGRTYPSPIVEHTAARDRALAALATVSKAKKA